MCRCFLCICIYSISSTSIIVDVCPVVKSIPYISCPGFWHHIYLVRSWVLSLLSPNPNPLVLFCKKMHWSYISTVLVLECHIIIIILFLETLINLCTFSGRCIAISLVFNIIKTMICSTGTLKMPFFVQNNSLQRLKCIKLCKTICTST